VEIGFHKNGVLILKDANGILHILDPQETLRDVGKYVWQEESLKDFRIDGEDPSLKDHKSAKFVKLSTEKNERLRSMHFNEDPYFQEY
jgi:hypothetical protein